MRLTVATAGGVLEGHPAGASLSFQGVRYGQPTGGAGRFRPPRPVRPWPGVVAAHVPGPACPPTLTAADQIAIDRSPWWRAYGRFSSATNYSEDCLWLNVWTPGLDAGRRPVVVWLHGGGFTWGSAASVLSQGDVLASRQDVVVVAINHRLGVLGFLHLAELSEEFPDSGLVGMLDIGLALRWIRDNISAFGGDPGNVTVVGHSGGGAKVACLLAMPSMRGLLHRAVIQSGVVSLRVRDPQEASATARSVTGKLGLAPERLQQLQQLPVGRLTAAAGEHRFRPVVDGRLLPAHPFDPAAPPGAAQVPLLIGTTKHDTAAFKSFDAHPDLTGIDEAELVRLVAEHPAAALGSAAGAAVATFSGWHPRASPAELLVHITTALLRERTIRLVERKLAGGPAPVFGYEFDYEAPMPPGTPFAGRLMSPHGLEIPFVFDIVDRTPLTGRHPQRGALAALMSRAWGAFARTGRPDGLPGTVAWPAYDLAGRQTMIFNLSAGVASDPHARERSYLTELLGTVGSAAP